MKKTLFALAFGFIFFAFPMGASAQTPPPDVTDVLVEYPAIDESETASFTQASCSWSATSGAASYTYTITEVESNTQIQSQTIGSDQLDVVFPVTQGRTYRCDVFATNATGQSGGAGSHSLLCEAEALIDSPTPTTATATPTLLPTKPPIESPGAFETTILIIGGITLLILGGAALILL